MIKLAMTCLLFLLGIAGVLWVTAGALSRSSERTVTYQYISDALDGLQARVSEVVWEPARVPLAREFTPGDEALIGQAMTDAWSGLALAQSTAEVSILSDAFSGVAQERAEQSVLDAQFGGRMVVLSQRARPRFYHLDGSVFQAEVEMLTARYMIQEDDLSYYELVVDEAITTLMNESNGWRVYAHQRLDSVPVGTDRHGWQGSDLAGINYYPKQAPWQDFWPHFDPQVIADDFDRIAGLNANAVRIFLTTSAFSDPEIREQALEDLQTLLDLAENAGLQVVPTLFDLKPSFDAVSWASDYAYLKRVLPVLNRSPAVAFLDLKNEPDLDFEAHGRAHILAWLQTMALLVRQEAPDIAQTIGWSDAEAASLLANQLDLVTYHDYADIDEAADRLAKLRAETDRRVMITEIGVSSYNLAFGFPGSENVQEELLAARLNALQDADGIFAWTLYDFPRVDAAAVGRSPWVQRLQSKFGLLTVDGLEKPSAIAVRNAFMQMTRDAD